MKIAEFFVDLIVGGDGALQVKELVSKMGELEVASLAEIGVLREMGQSLMEIAGEAFKATLQLDDFKDRTGESTAKLQDFQGMAEKLGITGEAVSGSIMAMRKNIELMKFGKGDASGYLQAGLQSTGDVWKDIANFQAAFRNMPAARGQTIADMVPGLSAMYPLLRKSNEEMAELRKNTYTLSEDGQNIGRSFGRGMIEIWNGTKSLKDLFLEVFGPGLVQMIQGAANDLNSHVGQWVGFGVVLSGIIILIGRVGAALLVALSGLVGVPALGTYVAAFLLIAAGFKALGAAWDLLPDGLKEWLNNPSIGGHSVGGLIGSMPGGAGISKQLTQSNVFHIYGTNPQQTADAVVHKMDEKTAYLTWGNEGVK